MSKRSIRIKICGMRDRTNILQVAGLSPHYMGFIFYPQSPRYVGASFEMPAGIPSGIKRTGVFVDEKAEVIVSRAEALGLDLIQLHGNESVEAVRRLKSTGLRLIKVFHLDRAFDFGMVDSYKPFVDFFLFDTGGKLYGGNAVAFDWRLLERYDQEIPFFLSGGLTSANIPDVTALEQMNLHAIDLNSGVELKPGMKDPDKIREIMRMMDDGSARQNNSGQQIQP